MIKRQLAESHADAGIALHDHDLIWRENFLDQPRDQRTRSWREFRRLDHRAVAGSEGIDQRNERQLDRVIPRRDDANYP